MQPISEIEVSAMVILTASVLAFLSIIQVDEVIESDHLLDSADPYLEMSTEIVLELRNPIDELQPEIVIRMNNVVIEGIIRSATHNYDFRSYVSLEGVGLACFLERYLKAQSEEFLSVDARIRLSPALQYLEGLRGKFIESYPEVALPNVCIY